MPLVSVIMPVYNTAEYLDEAVQSILGQTLDDFEFIIIDDGSTDGSADMLDRYPDKRIKVIHQPNSGIVASLNRGIELAQGKYIARMDSDDISLPDRLAKQIAFMESHPAVGICGTACRLFGDEYGITKPKTRSDEIKSWLLFGPCMAHPTVVMRRDLIVKHSLRYDSEFEKAEDYELWIRFSRHCEMANIPEPLLLYRVHASQVTTKLKTLNSRISGLVHERAIRLMGIEPGDDELALHLSLHGSNHEKSRDYVERAEAWFLKLVSANEVTGKIAQDAFARVLFEFWGDLCAGEYELGFWILRKFWSSRLMAIGRKASRQSPCSVTRLFLRVMLSRLMDRSSAGRSLKKLARRLTFCAREAA